jgi:hypothetical protein
MTTGRIKARSVAMEMGAINCEFPLQPEISF